MIKIVSVIRQHPPLVKIAFISRTLPCVSRFSSRFNYHCPNVACIRGFIKPYGKFFALLSLLCYCDYHEMLQT